MGENISHDEAKTALDELSMGNNYGEHWKTLRDYIRQQRAASVRVVEILQEAEDHNRSVDYPIDIKAGQELAIIERRAGAAAGEEKP